MFSEKDIFDSDKNSSVWRKNASFDTIVLPVFINTHLNQFVPQTRPKNVKFAVGMIVTHGDDSKVCSNGVIIGWFRNCKEIMSCIVIPSFLTMPLKMCSSFNAEQTCYIILTKSDELCCVNEDDITLTKPMWITNINIYHYFCKFEGTHYVPNEELAEVYPHDTALAAETIFKS